jgi:hypothetical protein
MTDEFSGIERRLSELDERLARLEPLKGKIRSEFDADPYLRDIEEMVIISNTLRCWLKRPSGDRS